MKFFAIILLSFTLLSGCTDWIFRIDVPQGNFLEQKDVDTKSEEFDTPLS